MSLYNMVCGNNPLYELYLKMIGIDFNSIPRFRDVFVVVEPNGEPFIVIHTRTGGGNRADYIAENQGLRQCPLFVGDSDSDYDSTYANFKYRVPEQWRGRVVELQNILSAHPKFQTPNQKFDKVMASLSQSPPPEQAEAKIDANRASELIAELVEAVFGSPPPDGNDTSSAGSVSKEK